jgi:Protein of unknown function (DUF1553)/Protein of unknown function (DUF1549)/Planctomycete cytochrome C
VDLACLFSLLPKALLLMCVTQLPWLFLCGIVWILVPLAAGQEIEKFAAEDLEYFEREIRPLLLENCVGCHSKSVNNVKGGLDLDSRQSLMEGGDSGSAIDLESPDKSLLLEAVRRQSIEMPPDKPLPQPLVAKLEKWIRRGAAWTERKPGTQGENWLAERAAQHWAWKPLQAPPVPEVHSDWPRNAIDAFILKRLHREQLQPTTPASQSDLLRRLHFDLIGLPPADETVQTAMVSENLTNSPLEYSRLVNQLLASPQFGVRWGRHWLDLMRYSETLGHEFDFPVHHAWRYRDAVINAINEDLPYNQFVHEHLAGDLIAKPRIHPQTGVNESLALTAWWWLGDSVHAPVDAKADWATRTENQIDVFSKSFLGMTVACARCHDHKFDAIGVNDYYGLVGVAHSIRRKNAITDPHQRVAHHREAIKKAIEQSSPALQAALSGITTEKVQQWLDQSVAQWRGLTTEELNQRLPITSPLGALRLLIDKAPADVDPEEFFAKGAQELRRQCSQALNDFRQWQNDSPLVADFTQGLPAKWRLDAIESNDFLATTKVNWFEGPFPLPPRPAVFASDVLGRTQRLELSSPTFELTHRCVCLKIRGKATTSSLHVNGYFMHEFTPLLFGDMRKTIEQPQDLGWVVHQGDLNKYLGDPIFLSLTNGPGAYFELAEVRQSNQGPPAEPHPLVLQLLDKPPVNRDAFAAQVVQQIERALVEALESPSANSASLARAVLQNEPQWLLEPATLDQLRNLAGQLQQLDQQAPGPTLLTAVSEGDPVDARIDLRGNPHQSGDPVPRGCMQTLVPWRQVEHNSSGRKELVDSLTDPKHPLVARVMVNRIWFHLMGRGLVNSPDNLGVLGSRPSHEDLLDYLASEFIKHNGSIKWLVQEIVQSQTYRLSSTPTAQSHELDADGSLYSQRLIRRLDSEALRDAILHTCNSLNLQLYGPGVPIHLTEQMTGRGRPGASGPLDGENRRSVFIEVRRNFLDPFQLAFDFPMPSTTTGKRNVSNVPAQALGMLNDPLVLQMSHRWADSLQGISSHTERVKQMIVTAYSRPPTTEELHSCLQFVEQSGATGWQDLAHALLNSKEFYFLR